MEKDARIDETPTHIALREAFVNALVHTDYFQSGNISVEVQRQQFVITNPGTLLVSLDQYYEGGVSECRNPSLQKMFMLIGRAEKAGSGVDKIMTGWDYSHWIRPYLQLQTQPNRVKLVLPMFHILPQEVIAPLYEIFDNLDELTTDELTALAFCYIEGYISNSRLQYVLKMHPTDITNLLKKLVDKGYLESDNKRRWAIYQLQGRKIATSEEGKVATSTPKVATLEEGKVATSTPKVDSSIIVKKRMSKQELENEIMKLCKGVYRKKEELAILLGKSENYLKDKFIYRMQKEGKIESFFPYTPNHPEQAYKTKEEE